MTEYKTIKQSVEFPVDLSFVKRHLNVDEDFKEDDIYILSLIKSSTKKAENYTGMDIALTHNRKKLLGFKGIEFKVRESPLVEFKGITAMDDDGKEVLLDPKEYRIINKDTSFTICFNSSVDYSEIEFEYYTGFSSDNIPEDISQAVCIMTANLYDIGRNSFTVGANYRDNHIFESLLAGHVIYYW